MGRGGRGIGPRCGEPRSLTMRGPSFPTWTRRGSRVQNLQPKHGTRSQLPSHPCRPCHVWRRGPRRAAPFDSRATRRLRRQPGLAVPTTSPTLASHRPPQHRLWASGSSAVDAPTLFNAALECASNPRTTLSDTGSTVLVNMTRPCLSLSHPATIPRAFGTHHMQPWPRSTFLWTFQVILWSLVLIVYKTCSGLVMTG